MQMEVDLKLRLYREPIWSIEHVFVVVESDVVVSNGANSVEDQQRENLKKVDKQ